jgi:chromosome segregation ATPase
VFRSYSTQRGANVAAQQDSTSNPSDSSFAAGYHRRDLNRDSIAPPTHSRASSPLQSVQGGASQVAILVDTINDLSNQLPKALNRAATAEAAQRDLAARLDLIQRERDALQLSLARCSAKLTVAQTALSRANAEVDDLRQDVIDLEHDNQRERKKRQAERLAYQVEKAKVEGQRRGYEEGIQNGMRAARARAMARIPAQPIHS